jgi:glycerol-3-phosphate dehydrogenase
MTQGNTRLDAARRGRELADIGDRETIDVLVIGGGITGVGLALEAASRGLSTVLVERHDLAFGTSRWSSKLVHGGLRYLASGQFGVAHESAAERHILMTRTAPHLTRPLAQVLALHEPGHMSRGAYVGVGYAMGDGLRRLVGTRSDLLRRPTRIGAERVAELFPAVRREGLHGGILGWDGQLIDDARLVVAVARTAAGYGARILTRVSAEDVSGDGATLRDELTGETLRVRAAAVINAAGVWAGEVDPAVHLRPSRGTHLVLDRARLGGGDVSLAVPIPGARGRVVFTVPAPHGRVYAGLTDVAADGPVPDVPHASEEEVDLLLDTLSLALAEPLDRSDVLATFAGLRPLLVPRGRPEGATADLSRKHAVLESDAGVLSVVGGKLTTYRRMGQDGVDAAVARRALDALPSRTRDLPLVGAWPRERLAGIRAPGRLVRRYGTEATAVAALPDGPAAACGVTAQELAWAVAVEGALTVDDLLDRRTRIGLVPADRAESMDAAEAALATARH